MKNNPKELTGLSLDEQLIKMVDICGQLQISGTIREMCESSLRLIKEELGYERISFFLDHVAVDSDTPFYGFYGVDQPIENKESLVWLDVCGAGNGGSIPFVKENVDILDLQGKCLGQADRLCLPIAVEASSRLGVLVVDNLLDQTPWNPSSIALFSLFSQLLSNALWAKQINIHQKQDNMGLRTLIDSLPAYIYIKNTKSEFLLANKRLSSEHNIENPEEMLGTSDFDYFPKDLAKQYFDAEQRIMKEGKSLVNIEEESIDKAGEKSWIMSTKIPLKNEHGRVFSLVGIGLDITEKKQYQQQVLESETCYRTLFDRIGDAILVHDRNGRILDCNDAAQHLFEHSASDLLQMSIKQLNVPDYAERLKKDNCPECQLQEVVQTKQGNELHLALKTSSINYHGNDAVLALFQDVTMLNVAREKAEAASKSKSAFLANMSHEIRTPLNAVIGMTSLLADGEMSEEQRGFIHTIQTSGDALLSLVNDILDLSKIDAGALYLEKVPFNLNHCIESSLEIVAPQATEKGLELACCINGDIPHVFVGDSSRLRQVMINLLNNAIKFTHEGEVVVRVVGKPMKTEQYRLDFSVADTGIGMNDEVIKKVLNPFEQADISTTRKYGGSGLGLSICNKLVEMMGGSLHVKSQVGKGSEFSFAITLKRVKDDNVAQNRINQEIVKGCRVLVVDDNVTNLEILEYQLKQWDAIPLTFTKGSDALENLSSLGNIDLAILDMLMPDMDGETLAEALRKRSEFWERPILILSSTGNASIVENPSANAWLTKPAKPNQLLENIAMLLENSTTEKLAFPSKGEPPINSTLGITNPLRILVAEDNLVNQVVALRLLSHLGYQADMVQNGQEVLDAVEGKSYDLILMDIQMPIMDGIEATEKLLQRYPSGDHPIIVAMTAHALQEFKQEGLDCGMSDYLTKPIKVEDLVVALKKICRRAV